LEKKITDFMERDRDYDQEYMIVYGQKGSGKTTTMRKCMDKRKGVVVVNVNQLVANQDELIEMVSQAVHLTKNNDEPE
jgi:predicted ABC-type ATPase